MPAYADKTRLSELQLPYITACLYVVFKDRNPPEAGQKVQMVGVTGLEPVTLRLSSACSNQLSYTPEHQLVYAHDR